MSTERCEHGNIIGDTVGEYRCYQCRPFDNADLEELKEQLREEFDAKLDAYRAAVIKALGGVP